MWAVCPFSRFMQKSPIFDILDDKIKICLFLREMPLLEISHVQV